MTVGSVTTVTTTGGTMVDYDPIPIPDDCLTRYASTNSGSCELDLACGELDVSTSCELAGGTWRCDCGEPYWDYTLSGVATEDACPYMASVCMGTTAAEYGDSTCRWEYRDASETFCETDVVCTQNAAPDEGVTMSRSGLRKAYCNPTESGLWKCDCSPGFNLILDYEGDGTALCLDVVHWCAGEGVVPEGTRSCTLTNPQSPDVNRCTVDLQCTRPGTINAQSVTLESDNVPVRCSSPAGDGNWTCRCGSTAPDDVFHIETAGDACTEAASVCADALSM